MAMTIGARELRTRAAEVLRAVSRGEVVTLTYRGRPLAEIRPLKRNRDRDAIDEVFGMWRDRTEMEDPTAWVRDLRRSRSRPARRSS